VSFPQFPQVPKNAHKKGAVVAAPVVYCLEFWGLCNFGGGVSRSSRRSSVAVSLSMDSPNFSCWAFS
jgi:hypothetical protein